MECRNCEYARTEESGEPGVFFLRCFADDQKWGGGRVVDRFKGEKSLMTGSPAWCRKENNNA